jgi:hypothetical protein
MSVFGQSFDEFYTFCHAIEQNFTYSKRTNFEYNDKICKIRRKTGQK